VAPPCERCATPIDCHELGRAAAAASEQSTQLARDVRLHPIAAAAPRLGGRVDVEPSDDDMAQIHMVHMWLGRRHLDDIEEPLSRCARAAATLK